SQIQELLAGLAMSRTDKQTLNGFLKEVLRIQRFVPDSAKTYVNDLVTKTLITTNVHAKFPGWSCWTDLYVSIYEMVSHGQLVVDKDLLYIIFEMLFSIFPPSPQNADGIAYCYSLAMLLTVSAIQNATQGQCLALFTGMEQRLKACVLLPEQELKDHCAVYSAGASIVNQISNSPNVTKLAHNNGLYHLLSELSKLVGVVLDIRAKDSTQAARKLKDST
ncbi:hypothetical protein GGI12_005825, partial [Dipsacomyces acuminosporus]